MASRLILSVCLVSQVSSSSGIELILEDEVGVRGWPALLPFLSFANFVGRAGLLSFAPAEGEFSAAESKASVALLFFRVAGAARFLTAAFLSGATMRAALSKISSRKRLACGWDSESSIAPDEGFFRCGRLRGSDWVCGWQAIDGSPLCGLRLPGDD